MIAYMGPFDDRRHGGLADANRQLEAWVLETAGNRIRGHHTGADSPRANVRGRAVLAEDDLVDLTDLESLLPSRGLPSKIPLVSVADQSRLPRCLNPSDLAPIDRDLGAAAWQLEPAQQFMRRYLVEEASRKRIDSLIERGTMTKKRRILNLLRNLAVLLVATLVLSPIVGELVLRAGIASEVKTLRVPWLYADPFADDDYWKLTHMWKPEGLLVKAGSVHPTLGWAPRSTQHNPLGIHHQGPYTYDVDADTILFFGDSFVAGMGQLLDERLPEIPVFNFGVGGYGVDQILLRFQETHPLFQRPMILFGPLTRDLDRSVLTLRTGQKPYFELQDGELTLKGLPIHPEPREYLEQNPPSFRSYFVALVQRHFRLWVGGPDPEELPYKRAEKMQLNSRILEAVVQEAQQRKLPLLFVIFFNRGDIEKLGWREVFLKKEFERLAVPYVDTKQVILRAAEQQSKKHSEFFRGPGDPHLNELGNRVVAKALEDKIRELWTLDSKHPISQGDDV